MENTNKLIVKEKMLIKQTTKNIGGMTYIVSSFFAQTKKQNALDKLKYLVKNYCDK